MDAVGLPQEMAPPYEQAHAYERPPPTNPNGYDPPARPTPIHTNQGYALPPPRAPVVRPKSRPMPRDPVIIKDRTCWDGSCCWSAPKTQYNSIPQK